MAVILAARRSAVCPSGGAFKSLTIEALAAPVIADALAQAGIGVDAVDDVIIGNALGAGGNPARRAALAAGLPVSVPGLSLDRQCVSGLDAIALAADRIATGQARVILAGGVESHSNRPRRADRTTGQSYEQAAFTPWPDREVPMADAADRIGRKLGITRAACDAYARDSHQRACAARDRLADEITPILGQQSDAFARPLTEALTARASVIAGMVSVANMAVAADAAAICVVAAEGVGAPLDGAVQITAARTLGADPLDPALAAIPAIRAVLDQSGLTAADLVAAELMEAFALQAIATLRATGLDPSRTNPDGGALARGHPIGASGAICAVRAVHLARRLGGPTLAAIPAAGGLGSAMILTPVTPA